MEQILLQKGFKFVGTCCGGWKNYLLESKPNLKWKINSNHFQLLEFNLHHWSTKFSGDFRNFESTLKANYN